MGEKLVNRLKDIREDNDLSQSDIAKILSTTVQQVSKWETGSQKMGIEKYLKLEHYYIISIDYLVGLIDTPKKLKYAKKSTLR